ncbi:transaldolase [Candidatus Woesearchaeota archaeon]|nr:transaldolase [Candidatus Woesearchaeota archaeon]
MKIFLDTAIIDEIKQGYDSGLVDGVTTNPSLMKKAIEEAKKSCTGNAISLRSYIQRILTIAGKTPVSLEVKGGSADDMIRQGLSLYKKFSTKSNHVVIKIPLNPSVDKDNPESLEGFKAIRSLTSKGIPVNVTLCFTAEQALLAAKAGATYISPFIGRIDDKIRTDNKIKFDKTDYFPADGIERKGDILLESGMASGIDLLQQVKDVYDNYGITTQIIAASVRNAQQARECALVGVDIATLPFSVFKAMTTHPKTQEGMISFLKDTVKEYEDMM